VQERVRTLGLVSGDAGGTRDEDRRRAHVRLRRRDLAETAEELVRDVFAPAESTTVLLVTHRPEGLDLVDEVVRLAYLP
jgi:hypothetical protein